MKSLPQTTQIAMPPREFAQILEHRLLSRNLESRIEIQADSVGSGVFLSCATSIKDKFYNPMIVVEVQPAESGCIVAIKDVANFWSPSRYLCFWLFGFFLIVKIVVWFVTPSPHAAFEIIAPAALLAISMVAPDWRTAESKRREKLLHDFARGCVESV